MPTSFYIKFYLMIVGSLLPVRDIFSYTINNTDILTRKLLSSYNKNVRGTLDLNQATQIQLSFSLLGIVDFEEVSGKISIVGFFSVFWVDERMIWIPELYNWTDDILLKETDVWTPLLILGNSHEAMKKLGSDNFFVRYYSNGYAQWYPGDIFNAACFADIYKYPYDVQTCELQFLPWGHITEEIKLELVEENVDTSLSNKHGIWNVDEGKIHISKLELAINLVSIKFKISRRPMFYIVNMILPICMLGFLNIFVFALPADSGERIGYSITVLLAIAVFQTIASDNLPNVSKPNLSLLCIKLLTDMIVSSLVTVFTIIGLVFYNQTEQTKIPSCFVAIAKHVLCRKCKKDTTNQTDFNELENYVSETIHNGKIMKNSMFCDKHQENKQRCGPLITWRDIGKASDIIFALFSSVAFLLSNIVFFVMVAY